MNDALLQLYIEGKASQKEKEEITKWLEADERNMQYFLTLRCIYDVTYWSDVDSDFPKKEKKYKIFYQILTIAASFLLLLGCYHFMYLSQLKPDEPVISMQTIYVPEGQRAEITLIDGTKVWLNARTSLTFPNQFIGLERKVELDGEAYFEVNRDETKQFIVDMKNYQINVLGTEFNVKAYHQNNRFETALINGSIEVLSNITNEKIFLKPNQKVSVENGQFVKTALPNLDSFLWKEGIIAFENESVKEIFEKLQLYYNIQIDMKNPKIPEEHYTGKFRTKDGIEHVLKVLQLRHQFEYIKDNDSNTIVIY